MSQATHHIKIMELLVPLNISDKANNFYETINLSLNIWTLNQKKNEINLCLDMHLYWHFT